MDPNSNTSRIFDLLVKGQEADKEAAKEALDDPNQLIDRPCLRCMILEALAEKFRPPDDINQEEDPIVRWTRGWLLNVLARISDDNTKAAKVIRNHLSPEYEHSWKVRYWTLAGLVKVGPDDLKELAQKIAHEEKESSVGMLAETILASKNDRNSKNKIMEELEKKENKSWELVVRALRFVYVPETVEYLLDIVEDKKNSSVTYDAIIALGLVPKTSPCADDVVQKLTQFIVKRRHYARYDQMRKQALISLRKLEAASVGPILVEELSDDNPAIVREAARALEKVLGTRIATDRVVEAASKAKHRVRVYANALRWMERRGVVDGLETIMVTGHSAQKEMATTLLSEIGGVEAFQKLQTRAKSMVQHADVLEKAEEKIRTLFETSIKEANNGFRLSTVMDAVVFFLGVVLVAVSAWFALSQGGDLNNWAGVGLTGGTGVLGIIYGTLIAKPRQRVRENVDHLMYLKVIFLAYLRQLHQVDQGYTRRLLEEESLAPEEVGAFSELVEKTMCNAVEQFITLNHNGNEVEK